MKQLFFVAALISFLYRPSQAQETYAEKLGYPKGKKIILFHIDDAGMSVSYTHLDVYKRQSSGSAES